MTGPDDTFNNLKDRLIAATGSPGLTSFHDGRVHMTLSEWGRLIGIIERVSQPVAYTLYVTETLWDGRTLSYPLHDLLGDRGAAQEEVDLRNARFGTIQHAELALVVLESAAPSPDAVVTAAASGHVALRGRAARGPRRRVRRRSRLVGQQ